MLQLRTDKLEPHPIALKYRGMHDSEYSELLTGMRVTGYDKSRPIVTLDGQILDGIHRHKAAQELDLAYAVIEYDGIDPEEFVRACNLSRRHLSEFEQWEMKLTHNEALRSAKNIDTDQYNIGGALGEPAKKNMEQIAEELHSSASIGFAVKRIMNSNDDALLEKARAGEGSITAVTTVLQSNNEDLIRRARNGEIPIKRAASIARKSKKRSDDLLAGKPHYHPAKYSEGLIPAFAMMVPAPAKILDPFAGSGKIHLMRDHGEYSTVGVEIEKEYADQHPDTIWGDARHMTFSDGEFDAIVTSPTYGNDMAGNRKNSFDAADRHNYSSALERPLSEGNTGVYVWGEKYRQLHEEAWIEIYRVLKTSGILVLNIKDHWRRDQGHMPVAGWHITYLVATMGMRIDKMFAMPAPSNKSVEHSDKRIGDSEWVIALTK